MKGFNLLFILLLFIYSCSLVKEKAQYTISISAEKGGIVSISGGTFEEGSTVKITATPDNGYVFKSWSNGSTDNPLTIEITQNTTLMASFSIDYQIVTVGENKLYIDKTSIPKGDNYKLISEVITSSGNVKLYFQNTINRDVSNIAIWETKLIKWSGATDSVKNPILVKPKGQIVKPIVGNLYDYLDDKYDLPFIYSWIQQINITHNKPLAWEGKYLDYDGDGNPDLFGLRNNDDSSKDLVVVGYDPTTRNYFQKKEINLIKDLNFNPNDSLNTGTTVVGDFNNDDILDFFGNAHGEWMNPNADDSSPSTSTNIFFTGPMFASISEESGSYTSLIIDKEKYLRFPGSLKPVDWNFDGLLDVFASLPYMVYLNNGDGTFNKVDLSSKIDPDLDWVSIAFDDLNNDGYIDIVGANFNMQSSQGFGMEIYYGKSDGSYDYETVYHPLYNQLWNGSDDLTIVDVDGDGHKEILTYNMIELHLDLNRAYDVSELREFKSTGKGYSLNSNSNYNVTIKTDGGAGSNSTTAWDYDSDGDLDIFLQSHRDTSTLHIHNQFVELPIDATYNQFYKIEYIDTNDIANYNSYISGFFFENVNGVLVKRYFSELYTD